MKKLFTFVFAALMSAGMWADQAVLSYNLGPNGAELTDETGKVRVIVGATGSEAEGWTLAMAGDQKVWGKGDKLTINTKQYKTLKNSNGVQDTILLPDGLYASRVEFYAVTNDDTNKGTLKEFDGEACRDSVYSLKDYSNPTYIVKDLTLPKNVFTFTFGGKQVCFVAVVTYSNEVPETPKPVALLSYNLGIDGADLGDAGKVNSITGSAGSAAEGWTIAMTGDASKSWAGGGKLTYKGNEYKTLKNSNGVQITLTLPTGLYASKVEFYAVTNDNAEVGSLKEFDGEAVRDTVFSLKDYTAPTYIVKELTTPKNVFTFMFGGKQVCFLAAVTYSDEEPEGIEEVKATTKAVKIIRNGQVIIIRDGKEYNLLGTKL